MPAQHFVPAFAKALHVSPRAQAHALRALALATDDTPPAEWGPRAAAALRLGAEWAGESWAKQDVARSIGLAEKDVAQHYAKLAAQLKRAAP